MKELKQIADKNIPKVLIECCLLKNISYFIFELNWSILYFLFYFKVKAAQFDIVKHIRQDMITVGLENAISTGKTKI